MPYFYVEPEVAGGLGDGTEMDRSVHPPTVTRLHYRFEGWLGDVLLESFPVFIVTEDAEAALLDRHVTGASFDQVETTTSDQFDELYPDRMLPRFVWLKPEGVAGSDDVGTASDGRLVLSQRAIDAIGSLSHALIEPYDDNG